MPSTVLSKLHAFCTRGFCLPQGRVGARASIAVVLQPAVELLSPFLSARASPGWSKSAACVSWDCPICCACLPHVTCVTLGLPLSRQWGRWSVCNGLLHQHSVASCGASILGVLPLWLFVLGAHPTPVCPALWRLSRSVASVSLAAVSQGQVPAGAAGNAGALLRETHSSGQSAGGSSCFFRMCGRQRGEERFALKLAFCVRHGHVLVARNSKQARVGQCSGRRLRP